MVIKFLVGLVLSGGFWYLGTHPETREMAQISEPVHASSVKPNDVSPKKEEPVTEPLTQPNLPDPTTNDKLPPPPPQNVPIVVASPQDIVWNRLIAEGFTREQTAGIMGNLQQEHGFKTSDVTGGLGIAQWLDNRRARLLAKENYLDINVQLDYMMEELHGTESRAMGMIKAATTVEAATIAFQDGFERCGDCRQSQRIAYAQSFLGRY